MSRLTWTERDYSAGVDRGVVYSRAGSVEAWNGLISVAEKPVDIRTRVRYRDGERTVNHRSEDAFAATIECFTYPDSLVQSWKNPNTAFDFTYRTKKTGGYEIHLVYNAIPRLAGGQYVQAEATPFMFDIYTKPRAIVDSADPPQAFAPTAHLILDSTDAAPDVIEVMEAMLYGIADFSPLMPSPNQVFSMFDINALYSVTDNGDGTFTLEAPDDTIDWVSATEFKADWPDPATAYLNEDTYTVRSW